MALVGAHRRLSSAAASARRPEDIVEHSEAILALDRYDEPAHEQLIHALAATARHGDAARADQRYQARMAPPLGG